MMVVGGSGVVSVTSNLFPVEVAEVVRLAREGQWDEARAKHLSLVPVHAAMFVEPNPGPAKAMLHAAGLIAPEMRGPMSWPEAETVARVQRAIEAAGLTVVP